MLDPSDCNTDNSNSTNEIINVQLNSLMQHHNQQNLHQEDDEELPHLLREQDRFLPIANIAKIMKKAIPERGKIAKDAKECVQECVSEFISFITSEAAERCSQEKRKTINGEDILYAMSTLGFDNYVEPLKVFLQKYRDVSKCDRVPVPIAGSTGNVNNATGTTAITINAGQIYDQSVVDFFNSNPILISNNIETITASTTNGHHYATVRDDEDEDGDDDEDEDDDDVDGLGI